MSPTPVNTSGNKHARGRDLYTVPVAAVERPAMETSGRVKGIGPKLPSIGPLSVPSPAVVAV